jgi:uracil-DNA glycosylase
MARRAASPPPPPQHSGPGVPGGGAPAPRRPEAPTSAAPVPDWPSLSSLREAARGCRACDLWERGTQTVFGEGPTPAAVMLLGEEPGDQEDRQGRPFVGPAGRLLDEKHFKWEPRGKRRIHQKPNAMEIAACRPWLEAEVAVVQPQVIVCLGATAAQAVLGKAFKVTKQRGEFVPSGLGPIATATVHPSSVLRAPDDAMRHAETERLRATGLRRNA